MQRTDLLSPEQSEALTKLRSWYEDPGASPFFLLEGGAGTGKTFLIRAFADSVKGNSVFTAPTNKAVRVLRQTMTDENFKPKCSTIYSLLGLKLEANGEVKELTGPKDDEEIDLSGVRYVVLDEGSMVSSTLWTEVLKAQSTFGFKLIVMGDDCQLPPVKEATSPIWKLREGPSTTLTKVMRFDNQILTLATGLRQAVRIPHKSFTIRQDNDGTEGVWKLADQEFEQRIRQAVSAGRFSGEAEAKAIAWRNVTVDKLNAMIRKQLFDNAARFVETDRVIFTAPAKDLDDKPMTTTDDEGRVDKVAIDSHPIYSGFKCWRLSITLDTNKVVVAWVLHESSFQDFDNRCERLAQEARADRRRWKFFWDFKDAFHGVRHAYAITAHRSQGSTYDSVFVDWKDIMRNPNRAEALRCLYVACTRPKKELYLG